MFRVTRDDEEQTLQSQSPPAQFRRPELRSCPVQGEATRQVSDIGGGILLGVLSMTTDKLKHCMKQIVSSTVSLSLFSSRKTTAILLPSKAVTSD